MGKTTLLKMVILTVVMLGSFSALNAQTTVTYTFSEKGFTNAQVITSGSIDANLDYLAEKNSGSNAPTYYTSGTNARFYAATTDGNGCSYQITAKNGAKINSIEIYGVSSYVPSVKYNVDGGADIGASLSGTTYTISGLNATTLKFRNAITGASTQLRFTGYKIAYTLNTAEPSVVVSPSLLTFENTNLNVTSASQAVTITGTNLTSAPAYTITGSDAAQFAATGTLTTAGGSVDVTFTPTSAGAKSATLEITSGTITKTVALTGTGIDISNPYNLDDSSPLTSLNETFGDGTGTPTTLPSGWKSVSVQGSKNWEMKLYNSNNYAQMSAFGGTGAFQTLLVSPAINFDAIQKNNVKFDWLAGYANGATLKVYIMQKDGTKTEVKTINATTPATGYATAFTTETIDLSAYSGVKFLVFEYNGNTTTPATTTYQIDNVVASEVQATITITETTIPAMTAEVNATDTKTFNVGGSGLSENINLNITGADAAMFGVSPATLTLEGNAVPDQFVTITYKPTTAGSHNATLEITSTGADTKTIALTGSATDVGTGNVKVQQTAKAWAANGKIMVEATAGEAIEIYNAIGQKLISRIASEGLNEIDLHSKGVHLVKVSNRVAKVVL